MVARERTSSVDTPVRKRVSNALAALPGIEGKGSWEFKWLEYEMDLSHHSTVKEEVEILRWIRPLEIAAAPEVAAVLEVDERYTLLVRRYWACPGEKRIPADDSTAPFAPAARDRYRRDMKKLADHGKVHPYARGLGHMLVSETTGTLLLNTWPVCKDGSEREREEFLQSIEFQLERRS
jgi:hypothetical protein